MQSFFNPYPFGLIAKVWLFFSFVFGFLWITASIAAFQYGLVGEPTFQYDIGSLLVTMILGFIFGIIFMYYPGLLIGRIGLKMVKRFSS